MFAPAAAREIEFKLGVTIVVDGDVEDSRLSDGSLLLKWKSGTGGFELPGYAKIWALVVGGGGGGGVGSEGNRYGAGGGGGAGGFVESGYSMWTAGEYQLQVGEGGPAKAAAANASGNDGENSYITNVTKNVEALPVAYGGGGGGYESIGRPGGSGGGGSYVDGLAAGVEGQGNAGGEGSRAQTGAGGGGAGEPGFEPPSTRIGGNGGKGKRSGIECDVDVAEEDWPWYAGGGGGAIQRTIDDTRNETGKGGSGVGGDGADCGEAKATSGLPNTGGGGGGGSETQAGGAGGSGVVIVRIFWANAGGVPKPPATTNFVYTGNEIVCFDNVPELYTIDGTAVATNVDEYVFTAMLQPGMHWGDDESDTDPVECHWSITPMEVEPPAKTAESFTYNGGEQRGYEEGARYTLSSENVATNAGTYTVTAALVDKENTVWSDTKTTDDKTLSWTIKPLEVAPPGKRADSFTYNGAEQTGFTTSARYEFTTDWPNVNVATNAGTYTPKAVLVDKQNTVWSDTKNVIDKSLEWTILRRPVAKPELIKVPEGGIVYDGKDHVVMTNALAWTFNDGCRTNATDVGKYSFTLILDPNYCWVGGGVEQVTYNWEIIKQPVPEPAHTEYFCYDGEGHWPIIEAPGQRFYLTGDSCATNVDAYTVTVRLNDPANYVWQGAGHSNPQSYAWDITQRVNQIVGLSIDGWQVGKESSAPHWTVDGFTSPGEPTLMWSTNRYAAAGEWASWMTSRPNKAGVYWLRATIRETANWSAAEAYASFVLYNHPSECLTDYVDITLSGYSQTTEVLTNYPALIRLSESTATTGPGTAVNGFDYTRAGEGGADLCFTFALSEREDQILPYEVDTWNTNGESLVWVMIPELRPQPNPTTIRLYWAKKPGMAVPAVHPEQVWTNFYGVWHMNRISPDNKKEIVDSTGRAAPARIVSGEITFANGLLGTRATANNNITTQNSALDKIAVLVTYDAALRQSISDTMKNRGSFEIIHTAKYPVVDEARFIDTAAPGYTAWKAEEPKTMSDPNYAVRGIVHREGIQQDYWTTLPSLSTNVWDEGADTSSTFHYGSLKSGGEIILTYRVLPRGTITNELPTTMGEYVAIFDRAPTEGWALAGGPVEIPFMILAHAPYPVIDSDYSASGRILLANNDFKNSGKADSPEVDGQGWFDNPDDFPKTPRDPGYTALPTYWKFPSTVPVTMFNLHKATEAILWRNEENKRCLWHLQDCRQGNLFPADDAVALPANQNFLPWSPTSLVAGNHIAVRAKRSQVGCIMMRNVVGAAVTSGCFTNGIGTIYFDTVNFRTDRDATMYKFVIEYVTQQDVDFDLADDSNFASGEGETFIYTKLEGKWHMATMVPMLTENGGEFSNEPVTTEFAPHITTGGGTNAFYRIRATLNTREPIRFRIRRTTIGTGNADGNILQPAPFIILDNILVSKPPQEARLVSAGGDIDPMRTGKTVLGSPCAFSTPFPSITDRGVYGRAKLEWLDPPRSADTIASATMRYRWRYLNQATDRTWRSVKLDPNDGFRTVTPLVYSQLEGDIEYYFTATVRGGYFEYCATNDYSGATWITKSVGDFTEELSALETRLDSPKPLASDGTDWFVRLRNGKSDWEGVVVEVTEGALLGRYPMELVEDNQWRALVPVKKDQDGEIRFRFRGENLQVAGEPYTTGVGRVWSPTAREGTAAIPMPDSGRLRESAEGSTITLDHAAGYIEFKMSDKFLTYTVARAEKQDFNDWNDAKVPKLFSVNRNGTNGVDVVKMKRYDMAKNLASWTLFDHTNVNWNETFYLADANDPRYPRDIVFVQHDTPNRWDANSISFVGEKLATMTSLSGCAGKILGQGLGKIEFSRANNGAPDGLETVKFRSRIGQAADFDSVGYYTSGMASRQHMIFVPLTMSQACHEDGSMLDDMAVGASVSLVECYFANRGCYEFRISRPVAGKKRTLALHKWFIDHGAVTNVVLCSREFEAIAWTDDAAKQAKYRRFYGAFLSFDATVKGKTRLVCGITRDAFQLDIDELKPAAQFSNQPFDGLIYEDTAGAGIKPWTSGSFGMMAKDCPSQFIMPVEFATALDLSQSMGLKTYEIVKNVSWYFPSTWKNGNVTVENKVFLPGADDAGIFIDVRDEMKEDLAAMAEGLDPVYWSLPQMRLELVNDKTISPRERWVGLRTPTDLEQTAILQVRQKGLSSEAAWTNVFERTVRSYSLEQNEIEVPLRRAGQWDIRLTTGPDAVDVVFDDIEQTRWHLPDDASLGSAIDKFTYTQSRVEQVRDPQDKSETPTNIVQFVFEPARADPLKAVSLRSPILEGLGHFSFRYDSADPEAEVWLQIATNHVTATTLANAYNTSIESVEAGEPAAEGVWTTIYRYGPRSRGCDEELGTSGTKSVYLGWHAPVSGVIRLFVPPRVVDAAVAEAQRGRPLPTGRTDYARIVIRGASVTDEPELSERAWRGWNIRTFGDAEDSEKRMYLADSTREDGLEGTGLSGALNNSTNIDTLVSQEPWPREELPHIAASGYPAIYSPTFGTALGEQRGVGEVTFKARLYATTGSIESRTPGRIVLYGARNSLGSDWRVIQTNEIASTVFSNFTWSANGEAYSAIKFEVTSAGYLRGRPDVGQVILDEIVVSEKIQPAVGFVYVRPFRQNLATREPIADIMSPDEQPLAGESWGIQAQVSVQQLEDEIDLSKGFRVFFSHYRGKSPWGYEQWKNLSAAVDEEELVQVGEPSNLVFRSSFERSRTLVEPSDANTVVQFMLKVKYYDKKGGQNEYVAPLTAAMWRQPEWYFPVDLNRDNGGDADATKFAGYTILDTVSPGRAWINEVNWNDGSATDIGGSSVSVTNQFVEVCIPSGVDMKDWYVKVTGVQMGGDPTLHTSGTLFKFGKGGVPTSKTSQAATNGYEFFVVQSPATAARADGGIKGVDGKNAADGTWSNAKQASLDSNGTISYFKPYQFELFRPSGVLEHQFVLQGTNTMAKYGSTDPLYEGTNLVALLFAEDPVRYGATSPKRFYAGEETGRRKNGARWGSAGVVGGAKDGNPAPGAAGTWESGLLFTPGSLNEGQVIPEGWFLAPNGTNSWIYLSVEGGHLYQRVGTNTAQSLLLVVPEGGRTNVVYTADNFFELDCITVDGVTNATPRHVPCKPSFTYTIENPKGTMRIVAHAGLDNRVLDRLDMKKYGDYAPSVVNWLAQGWPDRDADDIVLADYQCVNDDMAPKHELDLIDMYWLDIPPFTDSGEKEWTLRAGVTGFTPYGQKKIYKFGHELSEILVTVKMYLEQDLHNESPVRQYKITRLQGLDDARSDDRTTYAGWRSETFKVRGALDLRGPFLPFRTFVFDTGSFDENFESTIEILDPFSVHSPGLSYGWNQHPEKMSSNYWGISIDTETQPVTTETLKADDTY